MRSILFAIVFLAPFFGSAQVITTLAGGGTSGLGDGGPATAGQIGYTGGICVDNSGNVFIADGNNFRVRKVDAITGIISTFGGTGVAGYNGDNILATTANFTPTYVSIDSSGNILSTDDNAYRLRKINAKTGIITTVAGTGISGFSGDGGPATAAKLSIGGGALITDRFGNVYYGDGENFRIRKINASGVISTVCGNGTMGSSGDGGPATAATINYVLGMATDINGNLYFHDNNTAKIRKINFSTGIISWVAGNGIPTPYLGDGLQATSSNMGPIGVGVDDTGNVYIADYSNNRIEKVKSSGLIYSIVGTGTGGFSGDNGAATASQINSPEAVVLDRCNNLYIADYYNKRVRKVTYHSPPCHGLGIEQPLTKDNSVHIFPNPAYDEFNISSNQVINNIAINNILGQKLLEQQASKNNITVDIGYLPTGIYTVMVTDINGLKTVHKLVKE